MDHAVRDASADFIESLCAEYQKHNQIDPAFYERYRVKRGLRNADGTYREETATVEHAPEMYVFGPEGRLPEHAVKGSGALRKLLQEYRIEQ